MNQQYPRTWDWVREELPRHLSDYLRAPNDIGFYELGYIENGYFSAKYAGRAKGVTLRQRLGVLVLSCIIRRQ
jgi:hypothetical protein